MKLWAVSHLGIGATALCRVQGNASPWVFDLLSFVNLVVRGASSTQRLWSHNFGWLLQG